MGEPLEETREGLVRRLMAVVAQQVSEVEARFGDGTANAETQKTLGAAVKTLVDLVAMDRRSAGAGSEVAPDMDALRAELTVRLKALRSGSRAAGTDEAGGDGEDRGSEGHDGAVPATSAGRAGSVRPAASARRHARSAKSAGTTARTKSKLKSDETALPKSGAVSARRIDPERAAAVAAARLANLAKARAAKLAKAAARAAAGGGGLTAPPAAAAASLPGIACDTAVDAPTSEAVAGGATSEAPDAAIVEDAAACLARQGCPGAIAHARPDGAAGAATRAGIAVVRAAPGGMLLPRLALGGVARTGALLRRVTAKPGEGAA